MATQLKNFKSLIILKQGLYWFNGLFPFVYCWTVNKRFRGLCREEVLVGSMYLSCSVPGAAQGQLRADPDRRAIVLVSVFVLR